MSVPSLAELTWAYFKIGCIGFGGPFALISLQEKTVVGKGWLTTEEFVQCSGMGSIAPGPISSNTSAVVGYRLKGPLGAAAAYFAFHLPAVVLVIVLAAYFQRLEKLQVVQGALKGVFAAVVGLLVGVFWNMFRKLVRDWLSALVLAIPFVALVVFKVNPVLIVLGSGILGYLIFSRAVRSAKEGGGAR